MPGGLRRSRELEIAVHFGFTPVWLLPRLSRLKAAFLGTNFDVLRVDQLWGEEMASADLAVRFGTFAERGIHERPLIAESVYPLCSPVFAAKHNLEIVDWFVRECGTVCAIPK